MRTGLGSDSSALSGCLTLDKLSNSMNLYFLLCEIEMITVPPFWDCLEKDVTASGDIPRHIKGAEELPFESECEQEALLLLEAPGGLGTHLPLGSACRA